MNWKSSPIALVIVAVWIVFTAVSACSRRPKEVLNQATMENLMYDMHVLEGSLQAAGYVYSDEEKKNSYYAELFNKYGITQMEFDSCLAWYTKHPKQFERIYAQVITRVEALRADVETGKFHPVDSTVESGRINLWRLPTQYVFTKDSARNRLRFEFDNTDLLARDRYELSLLHRIAPSDSSKNPHIVMYVNYLNGTVDSIYTQTNNDSILRRYTLKFRARKDLKIKSISGYLLDNDSAKGSMSAYIDSVQLFRQFNPFKQDSIRTAISKIDSTSVVQPDTLQQTPPDSLPEKSNKRLNERRLLQ